jgi:hypothetical protein
MEDKKRKSELKLISNILTEEGLKGNYDVEKIALRILTNLYLIDYPEVNSLYRTARKKTE